jgi:hypothetical protein
MPGWFAIAMTLWALTLGQAGCASFEPSYTELVDRRFNVWLGKSKDDRIRVAGPPEQCAPLQSAEEACTWRSVGIDGTSVSRFVTVTSWAHQVVFIYDKNGIARQWHYSGSWGERASSDKEQSMMPGSEALLP